MEEVRLYGRRKIYTDYAVVDSSNVVEVLGKTLMTHQFNSIDIQYLYEYYKGRQPILERVKEVRPEINNMVVVNRANEIVSFKVGYLMGEPVQYVSRSEDESVAGAINELNSFVFAEDKAAKDKELADWFTICGTAYRMVLPDALNEEDEAPFEIYTLDPRYAYVVYHSGLGNKPVCGIKYVITEEHGIIYSIYTPYEYFEVEDGQIKKHTAHSLGGIPIVEYPANESRMGAFETVLPLLDAINKVASNRMDGIEQFVQALLKFKGVDIDSDDFAKLREMGGIKVPEDGDVEYLIQELNQTQTQTLMDDLYSTVLTICGMPNRQMKSTSSSDNNGAVELRDGWQTAESCAKSSELMFKMSEKKFLRILLNITNTLRDMNLKLSDIEIRFTRRNYENIQSKSQVLISMLSSDKIHPKLAFEHSGLFSDANLAYTESMKYYEEQERKLQEELIRQMKIGKDDGDDV